MSKGPQGHWYQAGLSWVPALDHDDQKPGGLVVVTDPEGMYAVRDHIREIAPPFTVIVVFNRSRSVERVMGLELRAWVSMYCSEILGELAHFLTKKVRHPSSWNPADFWGSDA